MIRCIPVDGSAPFDVASETECASYRGDPIMGVGFWCAWEPSNVTAAILDERINDSRTLLFTIDDDAGCAFSRYDVGTVAAWHVGAARKDRMVDGPGPLMALVPHGAKWLACRIESWRERAERLEKELAGLRHRIALDAMDKRRESERG